MNSIRFATVLILTALALESGIAPAQAPAASDASKPTEPRAIKSFDPAAIDKTADPCVDFYQYACGNWVKNNPIPADQVIWARSFSQLRERNRYLLWQELDAAAKDPKTPLQKQYGDYFAACMNTTLVDERGLKPLEPAFQRIDALKDAHYLAPLIGDLASEGSPAPLFDFDVEQDEKNSSKQIATISQSGLSLPDRDYYLVDNPHFKQIREEYVAHVTKMFTLAGDTPERAAQEAAAVMEIETALAKASTSRVDLRDPEKIYHIYTVADLQKLTPEFDYSVYFKNVKVRPFATLNVETPEFFKALNEQIGKEPVDAWKSYFRWHTLHALASNLPKAFFDENFAFFGKTLAGQKEPTPRWKQCTSMTDRALGEAVGQDWVKVNFPPAAKASMDKLVAALEKSLGEDFKTLPWMSEATKKAAEEKLAMIRNKIGYPEKWRDYSAPQGGARRPDRQPGTQRRLRAELEPGSPGQAGGREGVGDDAAHGQRLLRPVDERHQLPGRDTTAAVLRLHHRSGGELWRDRGGDRARDDPWLRRRGLSVRRQGQPARVANPRGPQGLLRARGMHSERVQRL